MRYTVKYSYDRYEIRDKFTDYIICFSYLSEYADSICEAMNTRHANDKEGVIMPSKPRMLLAAGKHYVNIEEISHIRYVRVELSTINVPLDPVYDLSMKNGDFLRLTEEEFKELKISMEKRYNVF
jgi:hypothetical protein